MNKTSALVLTVVIVVALSMATVIVFQQQEISRLYGRNEELATSNSQNEQKLGERNDAYSSLNASYFQTLDSLQQLSELLNTSETRLTELNQSYSSLSTSWNTLSANFDSLNANFNTLNASLTPLNASLSSLSTDFAALNASYLQTVTALQQATSLLSSTESNLSQLQTSYLALNNSYNSLKLAVEKYSQDYNGTSGVFLISCQVNHGTPDYRGYCDFILTATLYNLLTPCNVTLEFYNTSQDVIGHIHDFNLTLSTGKNDFVIGWNEGVTAHENYRLLVTRD